MNRPAAILSYSIAALSAMLSAVAYAEYGVDYPIAGGSFSYMLLTFGEFVSWCDSLLQRTLVGARGRACS
jgi:amino acid transporter